MFEDRETEERIAILNVSNSLNFDISPNLSVPQFIVLSQDLTEKLNVALRKPVIFSHAYYFLHLRDPFVIFKFNTKSRKLTICINNLVYDNN